MSNQTEKNEQSCPQQSEIAAFLDGELAAPDELLFEQHLSQCFVCARKLNEQKRLLMALDFAFDGGRDFELPQDFARKVMIHAESNVSGLRAPDERLRALFIACGLFLLGVLIGIVGKKSGLVPQLGAKFLAQLIVVAEVFGNFCYHFGIGLTIALRVVGRQFGLESPLASFLALVLIVFSCIVLSRLLFDNHCIEEQK